MTNWGIFFSMHCECSTVLHWNRWTTEKQQSHNVYIIVMILWITRFEGKCASEVFESTTTWKISIMIFAFECFVFSLSHVFVCVCVCLKRFHFTIEWKFHKIRLPIWLQRTHFRNIFLRCYCWWFFFHIMSKSCGPW